MKPEINSKIIAFPSPMTRTGLQKIQRQSAEWGDEAHEQAGQSFLSSLRDNVEAANALIRDHATENTDEIDPAGQMAVEAQGDRSKLEPITGLVIIELNSFQLDRKISTAELTINTDDALVRREVSASDTKVVLRPPRSQEHANLHQTELKLRKHSTGGLMVGENLQPAASVPHEDASQTGVMSLLPQMTQLIVSVEGADDVLASIQTDEIPGSGSARGELTYASTRGGRHAKDSGSSPDEHQDASAEEIIDVEGSRQVRGSGPVLRNSEVWSTGDFPELPAATHGAGSVAQQISQNITQSLVQSSPLSVARKSEMQKTILFALNPDRLGSIEVKMTLRAGKLEVSLASEKEDTAKLVLRSQDALREGLERAGIVLDNLAVSVVSVDRGLVPGNQIEPGKPTGYALSQDGHNGHKGHATGGDQNFQERSRNEQEWRWSGNEKASRGDWEDPHSHHVRNGMFL